MEEKIVTPQDIIKNEGITEDSIKEIADNVGMKLSDNELEKITEELSSVESEFEEFINKLDSDSTPTEGITEVTSLNIDPESGLVAPIPDSTKISDKSIEELINEAGEIEKPKVKEIPKDKADELGLTESDISVMMNIIRRLENGEKFSVYNELPQQMKSNILRICQSMGCNDPKIIRSFAKDFVIELMKEIALDQEYIDLQKSIKETLDFNVLDMWSEHIREKMEVDLIKQADILEAEYPEKAQVLRNVVESFKDSYTFRRQYELLETSEKTRNRLTKDLKKFKRETDYFNFKYEKSKFVITNITNIVPVLSRKLGDEYTTEDIYKFVMLLCKVSQDLNADNVVDHAFMYYSVSNIVSLDYIDIGSVNLSEFSKTILDNVKGLLDKIKEIEKENNQ